MAGRRQAPKRSIVSINKIGPWGNVRYEHQLECGHSEMLPRASSAKKIACSQCVTPPQEEMPKGIVPSLNISDLIDARLDFDETFEQDEVIVRRVAADIASLLGIPVDAVSLVTDASSGRITIKSAYIFLSARDISRLTNTRGIE